MFQAQNRETIYIVLEKLLCSSRSLWRRVWQDRFSQNKTKPARPQCARMKKVVERIRGSGWTWKGTEAEEAAKRNDAKTLFRVVSLLAETIGRPTLQDMTTNLETEAGKVGLRISANKTKAMQIREVEVLQSITAGGQSVDDVDRFTYLDSILACDGDAEVDVNCRIGKAAASVSNACGRYPWSSVINTDTKICLYNAIAVSVGIYASETWEITTKIAQKLNVFHQRCLRKILHVTYRDHVTNEVLPRTGSRKLADIVAERRFRMAGHTLRLSHRSTFEGCNVVDSRRWRRRGRPKKTRCRTFHEDLTRANISWEEAEHTATDRPLWHQAAA